MVLTYLHQLDPEIPIDYSYNSLYNPSLFPWFLKENPISDIVLQAQKLTGGFSGSLVIRVSWRFRNARGSLVGNAIGTDGGFFFMGRYT